MRACIDCGEKFKEDAPVNKKRCIKCAVKHVNSQKRKGPQEPITAPSKPKRPSKTPEQRQRENERRRLTRERQRKDKALADIDELIRQRNTPKKPETPIMVKKEGHPTYFKPFPDKTAPKRKIQFRWKPKHAPPSDTIPSIKKTEERTGIGEINAEQHDTPLTTRNCPESIKSSELRDVMRYPERYIEINLVRQSRVVDSFYLKSDATKFTYLTQKYNIKDESIYLLPTKTGMFMPTCYYREKNSEPRGFKQLNKGITGKAMSLLYMEQLYVSLLYSEETKWNLFIVILSIATLIAYAIGCYFVFFHNGGILAPPENTPAPVLSFINILKGVIYHG